MGPCDEWNVFLPTVCLLYVLRRMIVKMGMKMCMHMACTLMVTAQNTISLLDFYFTATFYCHFYYNYTERAF